MRYWSPRNKPVIGRNDKLSLIIHRVEDVTEYVNLQDEHLRKEQVTDDLRQRINEMEREVFHRSKEIRQKNDELTEANHNLESFTYSVSHDLRAPLRAIDGYSNMLVEDYEKILDKEALRLLHNVQYNARRMGVLIDELLEFSKLGRKELQKMHVNMNKLAENVVADLGRSMEHHAKVEILPLHNIEADYVLLRQLMLNLLSNAFKYSSKSPEPHVHVSSELKGNEVLYAIKDNGVGFNMEYAGNLFGVFQRLHSREEFEGSGVGLAIVKKIIDKHHGHAWAKSVPGEGATFFFTLPVKEA